ncbi:MAG: M50 family metallopeptidase [Bacilli bacterium]|nr:M50 family metallopeptidase [Bacilli bacterium]
MKKENNDTLSTLVIQFINLLFYAFIGIYIAKTFYDYDHFFIIAIIMLIMMYIIYFILVIYHEMGHLICAKISGYQFSSFRVLNFMWVKTNNKIKLKRFSLAGTLGQCLMLPPNVDNPPFILYNLGGILMNFILLIISLIMFLLVKNPYIDTIFFISLMLNVSMVITNGIPIKSVLNNDMGNIIEYRKNKTSYKQLINSLYIQDLSINGTRPKDLDKKYYEIPKSINSLGDANNMTVYCGILLDEHKFNEYIETANSFINSQYLNTIYRALLINDLKYCYIILDKDIKELESLYNKEINLILNIMNDYPNIVRTNYTYSLLIEKDMEKANKYLNDFNKLEKTYPMIGDYISEKELVNVATNKNNNEQ